MCIKKKKRFYMWFLLISMIADSCSIHLSKSIIIIHFTTPKNVKAKWNYRKKIKNIYIKFIIHNKLSIKSLIDYKKILSFAGLITLLVNYLLQMKFKTKYIRIQLNFVSFEWLCDENSVGLCIWVAMIKIRVLWFSCWPK